MEIASATHPPYVLLTLVGEVDVDSARELRDQVRALMVEGSSHVLIELSRVTFLDSSGLGVLVAAHKQARIFRGSFALVAASHRVRQVLSVTMLDRVFTMHDSLEDALASRSETVPNGSAT